MSNQQRITIVVCVVALWGILMISLRAWDRADERVNTLESEAVRLGHAEYVPDEHGNPTFRWREAVDEAP